MEVDVREGAQELLESGVGVWSGWMSRSCQPSLPPAAVNDLMMKLTDKEEAVCVYASCSSSEGRLIAGVWPKHKLPPLERISSKHVYSVAAAPVEDVTLALRHDDGNSQTLHPGSIKCSAIRARSVDELAQLRDGAYPGIRKGVVVPKSNNIKTEHIPNSSKSDTKGKGNAIAGMFAKQISSSSLKSEQKIKLEVIKDEKKNDNQDVENNCINSPASKISINDEKKVVNSQASKRSNDNEKKPADATKQVPSKKKKVIEKKKPSSNNKRKRIQVIDSDDSDSSDKDIFESDNKESHILDVNFEEEEEIPPTPDMTVRKLPPINPQKRKRDKTFMGEDGYFHTVKNVLCSDEEADQDDQKENQQKDNLDNVEEIPNTPDQSSEKPNFKTNSTLQNAKSKSKSSKKLSPPSTVKQSNIMNFFKKK